MRPTAALAFSVAIAPAAAVTRLDQAGTMAVAAGRILGAAAACGVSEARLVAARIVALETIGRSEASPQAVRRARSIVEHFAAEARVATSARPELCPAALLRFEQAERG